MAADRRAVVAALSAALLAAPGCGDDDETDRAAPPPRTTQTTPAETETAPRLGAEPKVETVATGLEAPWEIAFLPDGRALVTERPGRVRLLERGGRLREEPVAEVEVAEVGEGGLLGLAVDPEFERNRFVYLYRTTDSGNELARYRMDGDRLTEDAKLVDGIRAAAIHDGGRVRFGPDRNLYFTAGDAADQSTPPDPQSLNGKVLRLAPDAYRGDGSRPEVFSRGHRNPQGIAWQPGTGTLVSDEHGPEGDDELNVLRRGGDYGWPDSQGERSAPGTQAPVAVYPQSIAPSGSTFVARRGSAWTGDLLIGALVGEQIRRVTLDRSGRVTRNEALFQGDFGRVRTVVEGPDGALYVLTNNRDGRGSPRDGDDRVLRITPPAS